MLGLCYINLLQQRHRTMFHPAGRAPKLNACLLLLHYKINRGPGRAIDCKFSLDPARLDNVRSVSLTSTRWLIEEINSYKNDESIIRENNLGVSFTWCNVRRIAEILLAVINDSLRSIANAFDSKCRKINHQIFTAIPRGRR